MKGDICLTRLECFRIFDVLVCGVDKLSILTTIDHVFGLTMMT